MHPALEPPALQLRFIQNMLMQMFEDVPPGNAAEQVEWLLRKHHNLLCQTLRPTQLSCCESLPCPQAHALYLLAEREEERRQDAKRLWST